MAVRSGAVGRPSVRDMMPSMRTAGVMGVAAMGDAGSPAAPDVGARASIRRRRAMAFARDLSRLLLMLLAATIVALGWLLARTAWGRDDALDGDTAVAFALIGAMPPVWLAHLALSLVRDGATPGQRGGGLRIEVRRVDDARGAAMRRAARLALHPAGVVGWLWLAGATWVAALPVVAWPLTLFAAGGMLASLVTGLLWLARPSALPPHDRLAGTRLVSA